MPLHPDEFEYAAQLREDLTDAFVAVVCRYESRGADKKQACELAEEFVRDLLRQATLDIQPRDLEPESFLGLWRLFFNQKRKFVIGTISGILGMIIGAFWVGNWWCEGHRGAGPVIQQPANNVHMPTK